MKVLRHSRTVVLTAADISSPASMVVVPRRDPAARPAAPHHRTQDTPRGGRQSCRIVRGFGTTLRSPPARPPRQRYAPPPLAAPRAARPCAPHSPHPPHPPT